MLYQLNQSSQIRTYTELAI